MTAVCVAVAVSVIAWNGSASASVTWQSTGVIQFKDTKTGIILQCTSSTATMVPTNTGTNPVGHVTAVSFSGCSGAGTSVTLTAKGLSWPVSARPTARFIGETAGGHGISVAVSAPGCAANVDGSGASTFTGKANFNFRRGNIVLSGGNLNIYGVSGCAGLIGNGDPVSLSVTYHAF